MLCGTHSKSSLCESFRQEWLKCRAEAPPAGHWLPESEQCPPPWLAEEMLALLEETHEKPVEQLEPQIRQLLAERSFGIGGGDAPIDPRYQVPIEREVGLIIHALGRIRESAQRDHQWSDAPVPPQMVG